MTKKNRFLNRFPEFADLPRPRSDGPGAAYQVLPPSIRRHVERLIETYAATVEWSCRYQDHEITFDEFCTLSLNRSHARDQLVDFIASILPGQDTIEPVELDKPLLNRPREYWNRPLNPDGFYEGFVSAGPVSSTSVEPFKK